MITPQGAGRFQLCSGEVTPSCPVFADFTADGAGLISAFTVDGIDITPRVGDPSDPVAFGPVTARVRSSYRTVRSDALIVTLEVTVTSDFSTASFPATRIRRVRNVAAIDGLGPSTLLAGSSSTLALVFEAVDPGGRLVWGLSPVTGGDPTVVDIAVPALLTGAELAVPTAAATATTDPGTTVAPATAAGVASELIESLGPTLDVSGVPFIDPDEACLLGSDRRRSRLRSVKRSTRWFVNRRCSTRWTTRTRQRSRWRTSVASRPTSCRRSSRSPRREPSTSCLVSPKLGRHRHAGGGRVVAGVRPRPRRSAWRRCRRDDARRTTCVPDPEWWIADEAFTLARFGIEGSDATCAVRLLVDTFGVEPIIRRRVLTLDLWPVARA